MIALTPQSIWQTIDGHFNWPQIGETVLATASQIAVITIVLLILNAVGRIIIRHSFSR